MFDVVLSDFGRDSALRLVQRVADTERALIMRLLATESDRRVTDFFDEYRRIMFACLGDVAYVKEKLLASAAERSGPLLDESVLFGVQGTRIGEAEIAAIADVVVPVILSATQRGYRHIRLVIPCNTLGKVEHALRDAVADSLPATAVSLVGVEVADEATRDERPRVVLYTVPRVVLEHVVAGFTSAKLMLVGTALAREVYASVLAETGHSGVEVIECSASAQGIMDELLLASIAGDAGAVAATTGRLEREVFGPSRRKFGDRLNIVQASTDFDIGVGTNSLIILANQLVLDVYGSAVDPPLKPRDIGTDGAPMIAEFARDA